MTRECLEEDPSNQRRRQSQAHEVDVCPACLRNSKEVNAP